MTCVRLSCQPAQTRGGTEAAGKSRQQFHPTSTANDCPTSWATFGLFPERACAFKDPQKRLRLSGLSSSSLLLILCSYACMYVSLWLPICLVQVSHLAFIAHSRRNFLCAPLPPSLPPSLPFTSLLHAPDRGDVTAVWRRAWGRRTRVSARQSQPVVPLYCHMMPLNKMVLFCIVCLTSSNPDNPWI